MGVKHQVTYLQCSEHCCTDMTDSEDFRSVNLGDYLTQRMLRDFITAWFWTPVIIQRWQMWVTATDILIHHQQHHRHHHHHYYHHYDCCQWRIVCRRQPVDRLSPPFQTTTPDVTNSQWPWWTKNITLPRMTVQYIAVSPRQQPSCEPLWPSGKTLGW